MSIKIEVIMDDTCGSVPNNIGHLDFTKQDVFNYGIFHHEIPPDKVSDNDFAYLESKIPAYVQMYEDQIDVSKVNNSIICKVNGEAAKNVSEIVGIAVGLKSAIEIFNIQKKDIEKIGLSGKKEKRLDYKSMLNDSEIQIETKGTTDKNKIKSMIKDIHKKKEGKEHIAHKYGFVTLLSKSHTNGKSTIYVTDPAIDGTKNQYEGIAKIINYYLTYLSFILDNVEYNRIHRLLVNHQRVKKNSIRIKKIEYTFGYKNKTYLGQCFDKRLILEIIEKNIKHKDNVTSLFSRLTDQSGKEKYFLGIDKNILENINKNNLTYLTEYYSINEYVSAENYEYIQMSDGILLIISKNGAVHEIEEKFTEEKVKRRLQYMYDFSNGNSHRCGAPCRSRGIEGKACEILTYRGHCRYHR